MGASQASLDPQLAELARSYGIATTFPDWQGRPAEVSRRAVLAVLQALGVDALDPRRIPELLAERRAESLRRFLPSYVVVREGRSAVIPVRLPDGVPAAVSIETEDGGRVALTLRRRDGEAHHVDGRAIVTYDVELPADLPAGYHRVHGAGGEWTAESLVLVSPRKLPVPPDPVTGLMCQLYAVRSTASWGIGDAADLRALAEWAARELGCGFVLVNPLHAPAPTLPMEPSPYFPSSRRFADPLYLRIEDIPEAAGCADADAAALRAENSVDRLIDRDRIWTVKRAALEKAFAVWEDCSTSARRAEFHRFQEEQGAALTNFATWCALAEQYGPKWRNWPPEFRDPAGRAVSEFRAAQHRRVQFYGWLQWLAAGQLAAAHRSARAVGMPLGVVHDLAVGVDPDGADAWAYASVIAPGVTLGAPADMYNQQGQRWNLAAWHPDRLARAGFQPLRDTVRAWLALGGGLRIDHILGFFRQWWIADDAPAADGAYLEMDADALLGVVRIEAARAGAVVIGEDLGVVPAGVRERLRAEDIMGTSVLWFERDRSGRPSPPAHWRRECLATVTTHDLPPTCGYLLGVHVDLRARLGLLARDEAAERAADEADRLDWLRVLAAEGLLDPAILAEITGRQTAAEAQPDAVPAAGAQPRAVPAREAEPDAVPADFAARLRPHLDAVRAALYGYVGRTPALLRGLYLPDIVGDRRPVNQPGTADAYPNWRVPMADGNGRVVLLDEVFSDPAIRAVAQTLARLLRGGRAT